jgi:hypothetical protein
MSVEPGNGSPELVERLRKAARAHTKARLAEESTRRRLLDVIDTALDQGTPVSVLVWATGMSRQRFYQLRKARESQRQIGVEPDDDDEAS